MPPIFKLPIARFDDECICCRHKFPKRVDELKEDELPDAGSKRRVNLRGMKSAQLFALNRIVAHDHRTICSHCQSLTVERLSESIPTTDVTIENVPQSAMKNLICNMSLQRLARQGYVAECRFNQHDPNPNECINIDTINSTRCEILAGWSTDTLLNITDCICSRSSDALIKSVVAMQVFFFFFFCVFGRSYTKMAALAGIATSTFIRHFKEGCRLINTTIVPYHLGSSAFTGLNIRQQHGSCINQLEMFKNVRASIDYTYVYLESSFDMDASWLLHSYHKHRSLVKILTIMLNDGSWYDAYGPYYPSGKNTDAAIFTRFLEDSKDTFGKTFDPSMYTLHLH